MNTENLLNVPKGAVEQTSFAETVSVMQRACVKCNPLSMLECVENCSTWKLKNEFRELYKKMQDPNFTTHFLNTIKNARRLQILDMISSGQYSTERLQQELKKTGFSHSQNTITDEYLKPLVETELADESRGKYYATILGYRVSELAKDAHDIGDLLPPHSECYEEIALITLIDQPRKYEELANVASSGNPARILSRLQTIGLIDTSKEKDYIFFFKSRRSPSKETFSPTEFRVYENIPDEGISARKLAQKTSISLRRTYKYLRRLKGKKMIFVREKPKTYFLTDKGHGIAITLRNIFDLIEEAQVAAKQLVNDERAPPVTPKQENYEARHRGRKGTSIPLPAQTL